MAPTKERPILFSAPMVRAILGGRKTQTRRAVKFGFNIVSLSSNQEFRASSPYPLAEDRSGLYHYVKTSSSGIVGVPCPYGAPGDRLWVRETHALSADDDLRVTAYKADHGEIYPSGVTRYRPSIHMPRWASRITLELTDVNLERLQDITPTDAHAEGMQYDPIERVWHLEGSAGPCNDARDAFACVFEAINGEGTWEANPWVWALTFSRVDQISSGAAAAVATTDALNTTEAQRK